MYANNGNTNYTSTQADNSQDYIYAETQSDPNIDFRTIRSLADLPHKHIKQPNANEFYISFKEGRWYILLALLVSGFFAASLTYIQINYPDEESKWGMYFGIGFTGFIFVISTIGFIVNPISLNIFLEQSSVRLVDTWNLSCCHSTTIIRSEDIKRFDTELKKEITSIIYFDRNDKRKSIADLNFFGDEARYLVYVLNNHLGINMNINQGYSSYNNL